MIEHITFQYDVLIKETDDEIVFYANEQEVALLRSQLVRIDKALRTLTVSVEPITFQ